MTTRRDVDAEGLSEVARAAVLDVTRGLLRDVSWAQLTARDIASRADVSISVIHRTWTSKQVLVREAVGATFCDT